MADKIRQTLTRNDLFNRVFTFVAIILVVYGAGMTIVIISGVSTAVSLRMVNIFAAAFASLVSFAAGFLYGNSSARDERPPTPKSTA